MFLLLTKGMGQDGESKIFLCYPRGAGASPKSSRARWYNIVCVESLQIIKPMVVGFCSIRTLYGFRSWCYFRK